MKTLKQLEQQYEKARANADISRKKALDIKRQIEKQRLCEVQKKLNQLNLSASEFDEFVLFLSGSKEVILNAVRENLFQHNNA